MDMNIDVPATKVVFMESAEVPTQARGVVGGRGVVTRRVVQDDTNLVPEDMLVVVNSSRSLRFVLPEIVSCDAHFEIRPVQFNVTHTVTASGNDMMYTGSKSIRLGMGGKYCFTGQAGVWYMI